MRGTAAAASEPRPGDRRSRRRDWALALGGSLVSVLSWAAPAQAHGRLVESVPAADSVVATAPTEITLRFGSEVMDLEAVVIVRDQAGELLWTVAGQVDGALVTAPIPEALDDGSYAVAWRVISGDGAPVQGAFAFQVGDAAQPAPAAPIAPPSPPTTPPTTTTNASRSVDAQLVSGPPYWAIGLAGAGAAALAGGAAAALRRRPHESHQALEALEAHKTHGTDSR